MKFLKENLDLIIAIVCLLIQCYPIYYNTLHPALTQMQIFNKFKWLYIPCILVIAFVTGKQKN